MPKLTVSTVASKTPRETAGSAAFRAFDFQVNVSMARLLELHQEGKQFVAVFDHHDDLVVFIEEGEAAELSFFQVKSTNELTWTAKKLARRASKGDLPRSIVGKAYYNIAQFGPEIRRASILSNRPLNATLANAERPGLHDGELAVADLSSGDRMTLVQSLEQDFPGAFNEAHTALLTFERVPYDLESYRTTVLGKVVSMLEALHPEFSACASPFYTALLAAVGECTGNKTRSATIDELNKRVALHRDDISRMIVRVQSRVKNPVEWWPSVHAELISSGKQALHVQRIKARCMAYWSARRAGERMASELSNSIEAAIANSPVRDMDSVLDAAVALSSHGLVEPPSELYDLQAATIVELMESVT
ncbi:DUF4297 domain-containing protein [Ensifer sp. ENS05]|uniref:dsDNA nuclease domain-containing protein n=1 Tax=Ensifer sp. ENS05 TaxID=2769277 RepID=UPI0017870885|nr:dsDNA nuclease domain-containing protein [Ensifer sp. ENS05]MBD9597974.1 DUF4297 domain-containing protein [Ensifer sp. ENS05]